MNENMNEEMARKIRESLDDSKRSIPIQEVFIKFRIQQATRAAKEKLVE